MHPKLQKAIALLSSSQQECGELPPGFLYCQKCPTKGPYQAVIRFFGWDPSGVSGVCDDCHTVYYFSRRGEMNICDNMRSYTYLWRDEELFQHVRLETVRNFWSQPTPESLST